ncbi:MAG TPA: hypothetical protein VFX86_00715 [Candidatus Saccharimonadales bacterium]|nr:hypothetical protein [Candidatus Saccharimonadales bacterium]
MDRERRPKYIDHTLLRLVAFMHLVVGSIILIISGVVLFALPAFAFYLTFLAGFYFFLPGVIITFGLVGRRSARTWSRMMIPVWKWLQ